MERRLLARRLETTRNTEVDYYIEEAFPTSGPCKGSPFRHLIARYEKGGETDLRDDPQNVDGKREFAAAIPDGWSDERVIEHMVNINFPGGTLSLGSADSH
jgi:hypothetical protein